MAHHKSAIKRIRQNEKKWLRNRRIVSSMRTAIKKLDPSITGDSPTEAPALLQKTISIIDKAASKGIIHKNKASRTVSRLTRKVRAVLNPVS